MPGIHLSDKWQFICLELNSLNLLTVSKPFGDEAEPCGSRMQNVLVRSQAPSLGVFLRLFPEPNTSMMQYNLSIHSKFKC